MGRSSFAIMAAAAAATLVAGQEANPTALPDVTGPAGMVCGGCMVVADVAGVVFGSTQTMTQTMVVGQGPNGSLITTAMSQNEGTTITQNPGGKETFTNGMPVSPGPVTTFVPLGSVITLDGATLTSPTSYELFTAFSVINTVQGPSGCVVSTGTPQAASVIFTVPSDAGPDFLQQAGQVFINSVGFPSCSASSNVQTTVASQLTTTTATVSTTGIVRPIPAAKTSVALQTNGSSPSFPSITIMPAINDATALLSPSWATGIVAAAIGVFAWWL